MQELLALILRFGNHIVFLMLQVLCFYLIVTYNDIQKSIFLNSTNVLVSKIRRASDEVQEYKDLRTVNDSLLLENKRLLERLIDTRIRDADDRAVVSVSDTTQQYILIPAVVCSKSIYLRNNTLTLCKGSSDGIHPLMGVTADSGIVGVVKSVTDNYAEVITILHSQSRVSCEIKGKYSFGNLVWLDRDPRIAKLTGVPRHTQVVIGDTVVTSGYSAIFPSGLVVGEVMDYSVGTGSNEYDITVRLANDISTTGYVYVINNRSSEEQLSLKDED